MDIEAAREIADALINGFVVTASDVQVQTAYDTLVCPHRDWEGLSIHERDSERISFLWDNVR